MPTVFLADNQPLTQAGFAHLLSEATVRLVADRCTLTAFLTAVPTARVILDYSLFDIQGAERLLIFIRRFPETTWLLVGAEFSIDLLRLLSAEPNVGFLPKDSPTDELRKALRTLLEGQPYIAEAVHEQLVASRHTVKADVLTATEREVVRLLAQGKTTREIADERNSSIHTIVTHKKNIYRKLGVTTSYEVTRYALRAGIADPLEYYI